MTETQRPERKDWSASILLAMSVVFLDAKKRLLTQNFIRNDFFAVKDTAHCKQGCLRSVKSFQLKCSSHILKS